jgi:CoA-transferase family III
MEWPLGGLRVADLSAGIAGGYCTKVLADGGAEVITHEDILSALLGLTAGEIAQLGLDGIIGTRPASTDSSRGFR